MNSQKTHNVPPRYDPLCPQYLYDVLLITSKYPNLVQRHESKPDPDHLVEQVSLGFPSHLEPQLLKLVVFSQFQ